jgi:dihydropteroate synthase
MTERVAATAPTLPADQPASSVGATRIGPTTFRWGERTYVMGIVNVTPDSFSGDGLLLTNGAAPGDPVEAAVMLGRRMAEEGADLLDVGGESTRPGHAPISIDEELRRVIPVVNALRAALPAMPLSVDTTKREVAEAALAGGANMLNDIWAVGSDDSIARLAADRQAPLVVMHNRAEPRYADLLPEVIADLRAALERAVRLGVRWDDLIVDPGFGFGKTPEQNLAIVRNLSGLRVLGRPILLGTSRKSTLGRVLGLPAEERLEATLATTALGIAGGTDLVRVHDVRANVRAAAVSDAIVRANWHPEPGQGGPS